MRSARTRAGAHDPHPPLAYALARAAWIFVIRHADGRFTRLEGEPRADYAAALAASGRPARTDIRD